MITEIFASLKDNIKRRATNPFLGTLTIVYLVKNWEMFYSLFNFDNGFDLNSKLNYIRNYYEVHEFVWNLLTCILYTFAVLIATYLFLATSRYISNIYERIIVPWIFKKTDKSSIVLKENFIMLGNQLNVSEKRYEGERETRIKAQSERDQIEENYRNTKKNLEDESTNLRDALNNNKAIMETLQSQLNAKSSEVEALQRQSANKDSRINDKDKTIAEKDKMISQKDKTILELNKQVNQVYKNKVISEEAKQLHEVLIQNKLLDIFKNFLLLNKGKYIFQNFSNSKYAIEYLRLLQVGVLKRVEYSDDILILSDPAMELKFYFGL